MDSYERHEHGRWWSHDDDASQDVRCQLCPRECLIASGKRGYCFVRRNDQGRLVLTTYGRSTGFCIDPIEKKPLNHFFPGTAVLSFGTPGCNLSCKFCQNWTTSRARDVEAAAARALPEDIARAAEDTGCTSVAYTYNDPVIWAEYAIDTAWECRRLGIRNVAVTAGYIGASARQDFFAPMDAANVDLKGFRESFYRELAGASLAPVLETLRYLARETDVWLEITNLLIPGKNDGDDELREMCDWIVAELGPDVPLHFSAFHPSFQLTEPHPTPLATLLRARAAALDAGIRYVFTGNVNHPASQATYCPNCQETLIWREGYQITAYRLQENRCTGCGATIAGRFGRGPGSWGARRMPVAIERYAQGEK